MKVFERSRLKGELTEDLYALWQQCHNANTEFVRQYTNSEKQINESWMSDQIRTFKERLDSYPRLKRKRAEWNRELAGLIAKAAMSDPIAGLGTVFGEETLSDFSGQIKVFLNKLEHFDSKLSMSGIGQALRNYLVYGVFREMNGLPQHCSSAIFGYSMLYPYTDNFLDEPGIKAEDKLRYNQLIADKIKGLPINLRTATLHEKRTMRLLEQIEECYPRTENKDIYEGLLYMLEAQADSQRQYSESPGEEEIFRISVYKGGLSVLIDRYLIQKPLTEEDIRFYYGFGFLLQLCDDLQDITEDKTEGSLTLFSLRSDGEETDLTVRRLLAFTDELFKACKTVRPELTNFLKHCCCLLILISAQGSGAHLSDEGRLWLEERLPFSPGFLEELTGSFPWKDGGSKGAGGEDKFKKLLFGFAESE